MEPDHNGNMDLNRVTRQFQTGLLLSSNLPPMWLAVLTEEGTTLKVLVDWCVHTEEQMYLASRSSEEYYRLVQETVAGAIQVDTEFKREYNAVGIVTPDHPAFPICQFLCQSMDDSKNHEGNERISKSIMIVCCGILDLPMPRYTGMNPNFEIEEHSRLSTSCLLLRSVFPAPYHAPIDPAMGTNLMFGKHLERELFNRSSNTREYYENLHNIRRQLMEFRTAESMYLDNEIMMMEYYLVPGMLEYLRNRGRLNYHQNNNNNNNNNVDANQ